MKSLIRLSLPLYSLLLSPLLSGCFAGSAAPVPGFLFSRVKVPYLGTANAADVKTGQATCESFFGLVATGDCSVEAAKKNGALSRVQYVDVQVKNYLGVYATYTTIARGD